MIFLKKKTIHILVEETSQEVSTIIAVADIDDRWVLLRRAASILVKKGIRLPSISRGSNRERKTISNRAQNK